MEGDNDEGDNDEDDEVSPCDGWSQVRAPFLILNIRSQLASRMHPVFPHTSARGFPTKPIHKQGLGVFTSYGCGSSFITVKHPNEW